MWEQYKNNKREITHNFMPSKQKQLGSSLCGFTKYTTLLSHISKRNKAVLLISSMHHGKGDDAETGKPEIISFYNFTKGGVDTLDQMCANYSTGRRTRRWPMAVFFRILDIAAVNAKVLYQSYRDNPQITRQNFMKDLAAQLIRPHTMRRLSNPRVPRGIRGAISRILNIPMEETARGEEKLEKRTTCRLCPPAKKRKTSYKCYRCDKPVCLECTRKICSECVEAE